MNERILKLAKKSGATVNEGFDGTKNFVYGITMSPEELDKFAELIVQEMLVTCEEHPAWTGRMIGEQIKQHFGVEELPVCKHDWYSAKNPVVQNGSVCVICGAIDAREPEELRNV